MCQRTTYWQPASQTDTVRHVQAHTDTETNHDLLVSYYSLWLLYSLSLLLLYNLRVGRGNKSSTCAHTYIKFYFFSISVIPNYFHLFFDNSSYLTTLSSNLTHLLEYRMKLHPVAYWQPASQTDTVRHVQAHVDAEINHDLFVSYYCLWLLSLLVLSDRSLLFNNTQRHYHYCCTIYELE